MVGVIAMFLAAGAAIGPGSTEGRAADYIGGAYVGEPGADCFLQPDGTRNLEVRQPNMEAYGQPQLVYWYVRLFDYETGAVLTDWTFGGSKLLTPGAFTFGTNVVVNVPMSKFVKAQIGINWYDPYNNNSFELTSYLVVSSYQWFTQADLWPMPSGTYVAC